MIGRYGNLNIYSELLRSGKFYRFIIAVLFIPAAFLAVFIPLRYVPYTKLSFSDLFMLVSVTINGLPIIFEAVRGILTKKINVDELVSIAIIACVLTGEYFEAATVAAIMIFGSLIEEAVSEGARSSIRKLAQMVPEKASIEKDGQEHTVHVKEIEPRDIVITRPGEMIAVDAEIVSGSASFDESSVTGEPFPVNKHVGDTISAGTINLDGFIKSKALRRWKDSTFSKIIALVHAAENSKVKSAGIVERYASWFTPAILAVSGAVFIITGNISSSITVLIVGCPCSFLLSGPVPIVAAIANAARKGIMIKGGEYLEMAAKADAVFFDKTGTLTEGLPEVTSIIPREGYDSDSVLRYALAVEKGSEHPLAKAVIKKAAEKGIDTPPALDIIATPGTGLSGFVSGKKIFVGTKTGNSNSKYTSAFVTVDGDTAGVIEFRDIIREKAENAVSCIKEMGINEICILSGDKELPVSEVARQICIDKYHGSLTPEGKFNVISKFNEGPVYSIYVGDGLNDTPALKVSHVGIAMGEKAVNAALDTADIVLMNNKIENIPFIIKLGKRMSGIIKANIAISLFINVIAVIGASFGLLTPIMGAIAHNIGSVIVVGLSSTVGLVKLEEQRRLKENNYKFISILNSKFTLLANLIRKNLKLWIYVNASLILIIYLGTGFYKVLPYQTGLELLFGRVSEKNQPGLHYHLPAPFAKVQIVDTSIMMRLESGFRTDMNYTGPEPEIYLWENMHNEGRYLKVKDEALALAGDENLIDINFVCFYKINDPVKYALNIENAHEYLRSLFVYEIHALCGHYRLDALLSSQREQIQADLMEKMKQASAMFSMGVEIKRIYMQEAHPPIEVIPQYRSISSAREKKDEIIHIASAYANDLIPRARGEASALSSDSMAYAEEKVNEATGQSESFKMKQNNFAQSRKIQKIRLWWELTEKVFKDKIIYILPSAAKRRFLGPDNKTIKGRK